MVCVSRSRQSWRNAAGPFESKSTWQQTAYLIRGQRCVLESLISSGRYGHLTETGSFKMIDKERNHYSSIYGKIVDGSGRTVVSDANVDMWVPRRGKFIPAPTHYFTRFTAPTVRFGDPW